MFTEPREKTRLHTLLTGSGTVIYPAFAGYTAVGVP